jgi:hypothetical protein
MKTIKEFLREQMSANQRLKLPESAVEEFNARSATNFCSRSQTPVGQRLFEERNAKKLCFVSDEGKRRSNYELRINGKRCRHSVALVRLGCDCSTKMSPLRGSRSSGV